VARSCAERRTQRTISQALCSVDPAILTLIEEQHRREAAWFREEMARLRAGTEGDLK
jgi:hypothetical protein